MYDRIKKLRLSRNWSQEELAHKIGYADKTSIAKIEAGKVDIPQSKREIYVCKEQVEYGHGYSTGEISNDCYYRDDYESNSYYYYLFNHKRDAYK